MREEERKRRELDEGSRGVPACVFVKVVRTCPTTGAGPQRERAAGVLWPVALCHAWYLDLSSNGVG